MMTTTLTEEIAEAAEPRKTDDTDSRSKEFRSGLTRRFAPRVKSLSEVNSYRSLSAIALDWLVVIAAIGAGVMVHSPIVWLIAAFVVATRQHALLVLMHDASHYRIVSNKKWNDRLSNWFLAYPMLVRTETYRENHLAHHRFTNTDDDPDWTRKQDDPNWKFPKKRWEIALLLLKDLVGGGFISSLRAIYDLGGNTSSRGGQRTSNWERIAYYVIVSGVSIATGIWPYVLGLWLLPTVTILPVILRIRSIAEHFGLENVHELNASRNYHCGLLERFCFAPHCVDYHLDHHLFPSVPFYNLPELHRELWTDRVYREHSHQSDGLFGGRRTTVECDVTVA